ncbi:hypothetical protein EV363DRAFT_1162429, partial [Boletus edulis]
LQEPTINCVNLTVSNPRWNIVYPTTHRTKVAEQTSSVLLINKALSKESWRVIQIKSPDITGVEIMGTWVKVHIYNVYNDCTHSRSIDTLVQHFKKEEQR